MTNIFRELTDEEKKEYTEINRWDYSKEFNARLTEFEKKATIDNKPFFRKCAYDEFNIESEKMKEELKRQKKSVGDSVKELFDFAKNFNLEKYYKDSYFELLSEQKIFEPSVMVNDGGNIKKVKEIVGFYLNYQCKAYKHRLSIEIGLDKYNLMKKK